MNTQDESGRTGQRFTRAAGGLLRQGADELDAATLSRLNQARQAALAMHDRGRLRPAVHGGSWQAAAVAAVAVVAVGLWVGRPDPAGVPHVRGDLLQLQQAASPDLILMDGNLDLIENLEFFDWLGSGGVGADVDPAG